MAAISNKPMRIAMLSIHSSPMGPLGTQNTGGMSVYVRELARWLGHQGHKVDIFTYIPAPNRHTDLYPNVRLIHLNQDNEDALDKAHLPVLIETIYNTLEKHCRSSHMAYDVIHSHYWISAVVGAKAQARWQCPHVIMFHTLGAAKNHNSASENEPIRRIAHERWLAKVADGIIAPSDGERRNLLCHYHPRAKIIHTIPCGVDLQLFQPVDRREARKGLGMPSDAQIALYVGRFAPVKGMDILIEAIARLKNSRPHLHLVVVGGDGPEAESTLKLARNVQQKRLASRVTFAGRIEQSDLPRYYSAADFLAFPSHYESFGLVVLEALACGTPVVATPVGAIETIIKEGLNGVVATSADESALAQAITGLLNEPPAAQKTIRATVAAFSWESVATSMAKIYGELLDARNPYKRIPSTADQHSRSNSK